MRGARSSTGLLLCRMRATPDSDPAAMTTWDSAAAPLTAAERHAHQPAAEVPISLELPEEALHEQMKRLTFPTATRLWGRAPTPFAIAIVQACLCCRSDLSLPQGAPHP